MDPPLCECGCGQRATRAVNRFVQGHHILGKKLSAEHRRKISEGNKGNIKSTKTRWRMSESKSGLNNPSWRGGKSFEPYGLGFNGDLRRAIRERDAYTCQLCGMPENGQAHHCHHVDYCKTNNDPENLVALCAACHSRTNSNRDYWTEFFRLG